MIRVATTETQPLTTRAHSTNDSIIDDDDHDIVSIDAACAYGIVSL